jgi:hypothetical protein
MCHNPTLERGVKISRWDNSIALVSLCGTLNCGCVEEARRVWERLTIAVLVLFIKVWSAIKFPRAAPPSLTSWSQGEMQTYKEGEGLLELGNLLFSKGVRLQSFLLASIICLVFS